MAKHINPKQVARAIGVSESTLKRWCDSGRVPVVRTAGGHRRIRREDILRLVREGAIPFEHPEAFGLPASSGKGRWTQKRAAAEAKDALIAGDYDRLRQTVLDLFLCGHRLALICDTVLATAMTAIGTDWENGVIDVYCERRAVRLVARVLHFMQQLIPEPDASAPVAMGGTATGDVYTLPTLMVELVLQEHGWRATSLGGPLPFESLKSAMVTHSPRLFWLSVSEVPDQDWFLQNYATLFEACPNATALVVGGRALDPGMRSSMRFAAYCESLRHLGDFAEAIQPG